MDTRFSGFSDISCGFKFDDNNINASPDHTQHILNRFRFEGAAPNLNFMDLPFSPKPNLGPCGPSFLNMSTEGESFNSDLADTLLNCIRQTLLEEDLEEKSCMFHDPLALQAAEKSFYDVLGQKQPLSPNKPHIYSESSEEYRSNSSTSTSNSVDHMLSGDLGELTPSSCIQPDPAEYTFQLTSQWNSVGSLLPLNIFSNPESISLFNKGVEEASKFLPKGNPLIVDWESNTLSSEKNEKSEKDSRECVLNACRSRKNREQEDGELEDERSKKQSSVYFEEEDLAELLDKALLCHEETDEASMSKVTMFTHNGLLKNGATNKLQQNRQSCKSNSVKARGRKQSSEIEEVDSRTLLIHCAQAISIDDRRAANELLKHIRQHSSPTGDGSQRLTHYFANSLEARLAGTGPQLYTAIASKRPSISAIVKAFHLYASACPFLKTSIFFANETIMAMAKKETSLHIIDFGIQYGFQWPILIQLLSMRPGGPPKIRITGIELPQPGFRPTEGVEETGRRLSMYCERFNVPFEYNGIAQKWETIQVEDLKIHKDEMLVVNSLCRFKCLLDEMVVGNTSPRDAVLQLIREINPNLFVQAIVNGTYDSPFFVRRFREALFSFSSLFDSFDVTISRDDPDRLMYEREFVGREIMSVIACEGSERVERPETYKQWQVRNMRAGFRQLPLNNELIKEMWVQIMPGYHPDFVINEDGGWLLQGWKGRVLYASSCWIPA